MPTYLKEGQEFSPEHFDRGFGFHGSSEETRAPLSSARNPSRHAMYAEETGVPPPVGNRLARGGSPKKFDDGGAVAAQLRQNAMAGNAKPSYPPPAGMGGQPAPSVSGIPQPQPQPGIQGGMPQGAVGQGASMAQMRNPQYGAAQRPPGPPPQGMQGPPPQGAGAPLAQGALGQQAGGAPLMGMARGGGARRFAVGGVNPLGATPASVGAVGSGAAPNTGNPNAPDPYTTALSPAAQAAIAAANMPSTYQLATAPGTPPGGVSAPSGAPVAQAAAKARGGRIRHYDEGGNVDQGAGPQEDPLAHASLTMPAADASKMARNLVATGAKMGAQSASRNLAQTMRGLPTADRRPGSSVGLNQPQPSTGPLAGVPGATGLPRSTPGGPPIAASAPTHTAAPMQTPLLARGGFIKSAIKHPGMMKEGAVHEGVSTHQFMEEHKGSPGSLGAAARLGLRMTGGDLSPRKKKD